MGLRGFDFSGLGAPLEAYQEGCFKVFRAPLRKEFYKGCFKRFGDWGLGWFRI